MFTKALLLGAGLIVLSACDKPQPVVKNAPGPVVAAPSSASKVAPSPEKPAFKKFEASQTSLPPNFKAYDAWVVFDRIRKLPLNQDRYEKTADYNARLKELGEQTLFADVKLKDTLVFEIPSSVNYLLYDADKESLDLSLYCYGQGIHLEHLLINPADNSTEEGEFPPSLLARKYNTTSIEKALFVQPLKNDNCEKFIQPIKMKPLVAKSLEKKLRVYAVGNAVPPYMIEKIKYPKEFEQNYDHPVYQRTMPFKFTGIWVVNHETGEVLSKNFKVRHFSQ